MSSGYFHYGDFIAFESVSMLGLCAFEGRLGGSSNLIRCSKVDMSATGGESKSDKEFKWPGRNLEIGCDSETMQSRNDARKLVKDTRSGN